MLATASSFASSGAAGDGVQAILLEMSCVYTVGDG